MNFVKWSSQGMLRMSSEAMNELFQPTVTGIIQHIGECVDAPLITKFRFGKNSSQLCLGTTVHPYPGMKPRIIYNFWSQHIWYPSNSL